MFRSLRHKNFRLFYGGQIISLIGTWLQSTTLAWLVWRLTEDYFWLTLIAFLSQIPNLFFAPLGGILADRYSRYRLVFVTQCAALIQALLLAGVTWSGDPAYIVLAALALMSGFITAFDIPARQSFVIDLVGKEDLSNAIALNSVIFNLARIIGPSIAGLMLAKFQMREAFCFLLNGLSYFVVLAMLLRVKIKPPERSPSTGNYLSNLIEALNFVRRHRALRYVLLFMGVSSLMSYPYGSLMSGVADEFFDKGADGYARFLMASGVGAIIGAIFLARGLAWAGTGKLIPVAGISFGATLFLFSFSHSYTLSVALMIPCGASMLLQAVGTNTLIQNLVPDELRGRIMSFYSMMFLGFFPIGCLLMGWLSERFDSPLAAIRFGGTVSFIAGAVMISQSRKIGKSVLKLQKQ